MIESIFLITLVFLALLIVTTGNLKRAVVYLGVFSLISSFVALIYGAPDVAIAEAIIGSSITTVLYLVALNKYQYFLIYYTESTDQTQLKSSKPQKPFLKRLELFLQKRNMNPHLIFSDETIQTILKTGKFDLALYQSEDALWIYGCAEDYQMDAVEAYLSKDQDTPIHFIRCKESVENEA